MRRRDFIKGVAGSAATWPFGVRAQATPSIGYLSARSAEADATMLVAVRNGLAEGGYIEGKNLTIDYRFADGRYERMPRLLRELDGRKLEVIIVVGVTGEANLLRQIKASQIPIVFNMGVDPVGAGLVASLNRPGGNVTGAKTLVFELIEKGLGLLHELVPTAKTIATLFNPDNSSEELNEAREAMAKLGLQLNVLKASDDTELNAAFTLLNQQRPDAILVSTSPFYLTRAKQIAMLVEQHRVPAIYVRREYVEAGGLMSYGYNVADNYRLVGTYAGRILKGEKPADLPVEQPTKYELVINLKAAKTIGLTIPPMLLARADEVIE
jgi:putative tryptophan/tyrosine transport system substrate-binding protein